MSSRAPLPLSRRALPLGLASILTAGCGLFTSAGQVTSTTVATVTVTTADSSESTTPSTTSLPVLNEPPELNGLELVDPTQFKSPRGNWEFATPSGNLVCSFFPLGDPGLCHLADTSELTWSAADHCEAYKDEDPDGAGSSLVGWESDYREKPCHGPLQGDWPDTASVLPYGKKLVLQVDTTHGVTVTCGSQESGLTCANNTGHGFTASKSAVKSW